jgi:CrcB protein
MTLLYVAIGGAIGSVARFLLGSYIARLTAPASFLGTFGVNVTGCFLFGVIAGLAERRFVLHPTGRAFLLIGVLGGFTTFSSYTYDTFELLRQGALVRALANALGQVIASFVALWLGFVIVRAV